MNLKIKRMRELAGFFAQTVRTDGFGPTLKRSAAFLKRRFGSKKGRFLPKKETLAAQRALDYGALGWPAVSICVPLYNTPQKYLRQLLDSVLGQTCPNWQLCLADASDAAHGDVAQTVRAYQARDARIVYTKVENKGISANTNAAAALAAGEYLALADHDDVLAPHAVYEMMKAAHETGAAFLYSDEALFTSDVRRPTAGHFKPDFAPDYLNCCNYICHFSVFQKALFDAVGGLDPACDGSQDHDLFLKLSERAVPVHVPKVLYYWRVHEGSTSGGTGAKPYVAAAAKRAVAGHLARTGAKGAVADGLFPSTYKVEYAVEGNPLVSILIPNKDHADDLRKALTSIFTKTAYPNYEVLVVENNSVEPATFDYYRELQKQHPNCRVLTYKGGFNFSAINNFGARHATGEHLLLLNNDIQVETPGFVRELLSYSQRPDVGAVGAKLFYPDGTIQHAGVFIGLGGSAGHSHKGHPRDSGGDMYRLATTQNMCAVTGACLMVKKELYDRFGGLDEENFAVAYNDVDFCLRLWQSGLLNVMTPFAAAVHHESKSRGDDTRAGGEKQARYEREKARFCARYAGLMQQGDPYYNPHFTLLYENYGYK